MKRFIGIFMLILVAKFSLNYWVMMSPNSRKQMVTSYALEFAQKAKGKAVTRTIIDPEEWVVEIHVDMFELGI